MPVIGNPRTFHKKFKFVVEIDGIVSAGFRTASELSVEVAKVEYYEGGSLIPDKSPGRLSFTDVTLERGATTDRDLFDWMEQVADAAAAAGPPREGVGSGSGLVEPAFKRMLDIVQLERDGSTLRRWRLHGAWPQKFVAGDWDNEADENVIESVTLTYDFFELVQ